MGGHVRAVVRGEERDHGGDVLGPSFRDFLAQLERRGELKRIAVEVDPRLEMTEICDRVLKANGPALLFERPQGFDGTGGRPRIPVLGNLFGTPQRVALGMGEESVEALREIGKLLARFVVGVLQMLCLFLWGHWMFNVSLGSSPVAFFLLSLATVFAIVVTAGNVSFPVAVLTGILR